MNFKRLLAPVFFSLLSIAAMTLLRAEDDGPSAQPSSADLARGDLLAARAFRAAAEEIRPSLVTIETFGGLRGEAAVGGRGPTTGLVISPDGHIITSTFNFLTKPPIITVVAADGKRHVAKLLGRDDTRMICILKVEGVSGWTVPEIAPRDELRVGQWAVAVGVGFGGREPALSAGIISAASRIGGRAVQTDANTSPANYGGPLLDIEGRVIGICVPLSPGAGEDGSGAQWYDSGIAFAVPLSGAEEAIAAMKEGKTVQVGFLGVRVEPVGEGEIGAKVAEVLEDSPAEKAGLKSGDIIVKVNGQDVPAAADLTAIVSRLAAGDKVTIVLFREGKEETAEVTLAPRAAE